MPGAVPDAVPGAVPGAVPDAAPDAAQTLSGESVKLCRTLLSMND